MGYIPINRKLFNHILWREKRSFSKFECWIDLIQLVSYENNNSEIINGKFIEWNRGQYPCSMSFLCKRWALTEQKVRTFVKMLKMQQMINKTITSGITMITICNYDKYNPKQQIDNKAPIVNLTSEQQTDNKPITIIKEDKELNKVNKIIKEQFDFFWNQYHKITKIPKTDMKPALGYFKKLSLGERRKAYENIKPYSDSVKDKQYIKKGRTYLSYKCFNDEFETISNSKIYYKNEK